MYFNVWYKVGEFKVERLLINWKEIWELYVECEFNGLNSLDFNDLDFHGGLNYMLPLWNCNYSKLQYPRAKSLSCKLWSSVWALAKGKATLWIKWTKKRLGYNLNGQTSSMIC